MTRNPSKANGKRTVLEGVPWEPQPQPQPQDKFVRRRITLEPFWASKDITGMRVPAQVAGWAQLFAIIHGSIVNLFHRNLSGPRRRCVVRCPKGFHGDQRNPHPTHIPVGISPMRPQLPGMQNLHGFVGFSMLRESWPLGPPFRLITINFPACWS